MNISDFKDYGVQLKRYLEGNFQFELYKLGRKVKTCNRITKSQQKKENHWNKGRNQSGRKERNNRSAIPQVRPRLWALTLLCPLPRTLFPQISAWFTLPTLLMSFVKSLIQWDPSSTLFKFSYQLPNIPQPSSLLSCFVWQI